jgi:hypothetical protein
LRWARAAVAVAVLWEKEETEVARERDEAASYEVRLVDAVDGSGRGMESELEEDMAEGSARARLFMFLRERGLECAGFSNRSE